MKLKEVYSNNFLKSFGDKADEIANLDTDLYAVDARQIANALGFKIKSLNEYDYAQLVPKNVIYLPPIDNSVSQNVDIGLQIADRLWNQKPTHEFLNTNDEVIVHFAQNLLIPTALLSVAIGHYLKVNNIYSLAQITSDDVIKNVASIMNVEIGFMQQRMLNLKLIDTY